MLIFIDLLLSLASNYVCILPFNKVHLSQVGIDASVWDSHTRYESLRACA